MNNTDLLLTLFFINHTQQQPKLVNTEKERIVETKRAFTILALTTLSFFILFYALR